MLPPASLSLTIILASAISLVATAPATPVRTTRQDDSFNAKPPKDLALQPQGARKAEALAHFVEASALEESGEIEKALQAYRKVLDVDPGQSDLAAHVARGVDGDPASNRYDVIPH